MPVHLQDIFNGADQQRHLILLTSFEYYNQIQGQFLASKKQFVHEDKKHFKR